MRRQSGVALLTVLLLVAVMSILVMSVLDDIRFGLRRASNAQSMAQAHWYALGAETLAMAQIDRLSTRDPGRTTLAGDWNDRPIVFPVEHGTIGATLSDAGNCFNLNSVVEGAGELWQRSATGSQQFAALLRALDIPARRADALVDALVDWMDSDSVPGELGAEDANYQSRTPAYRTSGTLLAEPSELRAIAGFDDDIYTRLRPYACALPTDALSPINLNTVEEDDALLLTMLTDGALGPDAARRLIRARPGGGWPDLEDFWSHELLDGFTPTQRVREQVSLRTRFFGLQSQIEYAGAQVVSSALFEHDAGRTRLIARRLAPLE
ncbi:type II secretion system minor pseudopilin GspK [Novilysobacter erysipheiresistens]|uniref:Type II secretion system protein K n=1 Tax=Novilysobacter erysipheiresistens TaxID=1749332 RepID=A0ABU7YUG1_9GAMM